MTLISHNAYMARKAALFSCIDTKEGVKPRKKSTIGFHIPGSHGFYKSGTFQ